MWCLFLVPTNSLCLSFVRPALLPTRVGAFSSLTQNSSLLKHKQTTKQVTVDKVVNPSGSGAGASSASFHHYRHAKRREEDRVRAMEDSYQKKQLDESFRELRRHERIELERKTEKRRKKRQKKKAKKKRAKMEADLKDLMEREGIIEGGGGGPRREEEKKKMKRKKEKGREEEDDVGLLTDHITADRAKKRRRKVGTAAKSFEAKTEEPSSNKNVFENDGSFLDTFGKIA